MIIQSTIFLILLAFHVPIASADDCGGETGWTRIAHYDIAGGDDCPPGLFSYTREGKKLCDRKETSGCRCDSTTFSVNVDYDKVCGRVRGYQQSGTGYVDALYPNTGAAVDNLDGCYVDGVSITLGQSGARKNIWTFAAGSAESDTSNSACPCNTGSTTPSPSYVGDNYYCESGTPNIVRQKIFFDDPLWDGENCNNKEGPCCTDPNIPYFVRDLGEVYNGNDIEFRVCSSEGLPDEATPIDLIELYVKNSAYEYVYPDGIGSYEAGTRVQGTDGNVYECKPFPESGWCNQAPDYYAPITGLAWEDCWIPV